MKSHEWIHTRLRNRTPTFEEVKTSFLISNFLFIREQVLEHFTTSDGKTKSQQVRIHCCDFCGSRHTRKGPPEYHTKRDHENTQGPRFIIVLNVEKVFHTLAILTSMKESTLKKSPMCAKIVGKDLIKRAH